MRQETALIWQLVGKLIDEGGSSVYTNTTEGKTPSAIAKRIEQYNAAGFAAPIWTHADHDILVLIAISDLMWEKRIRPLTGKDEAALQIALGANALSPTATSTALTRMRQEHQALTQLRAQCDALPTLALTIAGRSALGGPANASQIAFDKAGADEVGKSCQRNKRGIDEVLQKLARVIPLTQQISQMHSARPGSRPGAR